MLNRRLFFFRPGVSWLGEYFTQACVILAIYGLARSIYKRWNRKYQRESLPTEKKIIKIFDGLFLAILPLMIAERGFKGVSIVYSHVKRCVGIISMSTSGVSFFQDVFGGKTRAQRYVRDATAVVYNRLERRIKQHEEDSKSSGEENRPDWMTGSDSEEDDWSVFNALKFWRQDNPDWVSLKCYLKGNKKTILLILTFLFIICLVIIWSLKKSKKHEEKPVKQVKPWKWFVRRRDVEIEKPHTGIFVPNHTIPQDVVADVSRSEVLAIHDPKEYTTEGDRPDYKKLYAGLSQRQKRKLAWQPWKLYEKDFNPSRLDEEDRLDDGSFGGLRDIHDLDDPWDAEVEEKLRDMREDENEDFGGNEYETPKYNKVYADAVRANAKIAHQWKPTKRHGLQEIKQATDVALASAQKELFDLQHYEKESLEIQNLTAQIVDTKLDLESVHKLIESLKQVAKDHSITPPEIVTDVTVFAPNSDATLSTTNITIFEAKKPTSNEVASLTIAPLQKEAQPLDGEQKVNELEAAKKTQEFLAEAAKIPKAVTKQLEKNLVECWYCRQVQKKTPAEYTGHIAGKDCPSVKGVACRNMTSTGQCPRGDQCWFSHAVLYEPPQCIADAFTRSLKDARIPVIGKPKNVQSMPAPHYVKQSMINGNRFKPMDKIKAVGWANTRFQSMNVMKMWNLLITCEHIFWEAEDVLCADQKESIAFHVRVNGKVIILNMTRDQGFRIGTDLIAFTCPPEAKEMHCCYAHDAKEGVKNTHLAYDSFDDFMKDDPSFDQSVVASVGVTFATYPNSSKWGHCAGPVFDEDGYVIGWHNGTDGKVNYFIPVNADVRKLALGN